jgi:hypothetical protein
MRRRILLATPLLAARPARAFAAGRPAVVNVMIAGQPAPTLKR